MSVVEPLPVSGYGKGSWVDYSNYWRDDDTEWIQERSILRYADATLRSSQYAAPKFGQVTYREDALGANKDRIELFSKQFNAWVPLLMLANITSTADDATGVALSHKGSLGKGIMLGPGVGTVPNAAGLITINAPLDVMTGLLTVGGVNGTNVGIKTGGRQVKLTTDATSLVVDSPVSATALATSGALTAASATITTLTAPNITMSGTLAGGVVNGSSGTIGGVAHASNKVTASTGFDSQGGSFYGDGGSAFVRHVNRTGPYVQVGSGTVNLAGGGSTDVYNQMRIFGGNPIHFIRADGAHTGYFAPHFWGDPGVNNCPEGSIMMQ